MRRGRDTLVTPPIEVHKRQGSVKYTCLMGIVDPLSVKK